MPALSTPTFRGMLPIRASHFLDSTQAELAKNCYFKHGKLQPFYDRSSVSTITKSLSRSIFKHMNEWLSWTSDHVSVINSPIANDQYNRIYYTGTGEAPMYRADDKSEYMLGVPKPTSFISSIEVKGVGDKGDDITEVADDESRVYVFTYVTAYGEEGAPSNPSVIVNVTRPWSKDDEPDGQYVSIVFPAITDEEKRLKNITHRRLYRSVTTSSGGDLLLVGHDIPVDDNVSASKPYEDRLLTVNLGSALVSSTHFPPPKKMQGITSLPNGISAGFDGNVVCISEPSLPYAWDPTNQLTTDSKITGIAAISSGAVVITKGQPYLMSGYTPDSMQLIKLDVPYGCNHMRSIVDFGEQIIYASDVGLISVSTQGAEIITKSVIGKAEWKKLLTGYVHAYRLEDNYVLLCGEDNARKCYVFSLDSGDFTEADNPYRAGWQPEGTDDIYLLEDNDIFELNDSYGTSTALWRSKEYHTPPIGMSAIMLKASAGTIVRYFLDGNKVFETTTSNPYQSTFRLPAGVGVKHQYELETNGDVESIIVATSIAELNNG